MSLKGRNLPLVELRQKKLLDILYAQAPADEEVVRASTALVFGLPPEEGGAQTLATPLGYSRPTDQHVWWTDLPTR